MQAPLSTIYSPVADLKVHKRLYFDFFDSLRVGMRLHMRESIKNIIFILNSNPISSSFYENWSFNRMNDIKSMRTYTTFLSIPG